ncbi:MAG: hypothetical protein H7837_07285 [Magnetococcus sp. MYC-9]
MEAAFYDIHVFCCVNSRDVTDPRIGCGRQGALELQGYLKARVKQSAVPARIRINNSGCLDRCALGPVLVIYPEGVWYHYRTQADMDEILARHILGGERVERLLLHNDSVVPPGR